MVVQFYTQVGVLYTPGPARIHIRIYICTYIHTNASLHAFCISLHHDLTYLNAPAHMYTQIDRRITPVYTSIPTQSTHIYIYIYGNSEDRSRLQTSWIPPNLESVKHWCMEGHLRAPRRSKLHRSQFSRHLPGPPGPPCPPQSRTSWSPGIFLSWTMRNLWMREDRMGHSKSTVKHIWLNSTDTLFDLCLTLKLCVNPVGIPKLCFDTFWSLKLCFNSVCTLKLCLNPVSNLKLRLNSVRTLLEL